jgi:hypothetical protein
VKKEYMQAQQLRHHLRMAARSQHKRRVNKAAFCKLLILATKHTVYSLMWGTFKPFLPAMTIQNEALAASSVRSASSRTSGAVEERMTAMARPSTADG